MRPIVQQVRGDVSKTTSADLDSPSYTDLDSAESCNRMDKMDSVSNNLSMYDGSVSQNGVLMGESDCSEQTATSEEINGANNGKHINNGISQKDCTKPQATPPPSYLQALKNGMANKQTEQALMTAADQEVTAQNTISEVDRSTGEAVVDAAIEQLETTQIENEQEEVMSESETVRICEDDQEEQHQVSLLNPQADEFMVSIPQSSEQTLNPEANEFTVDSDGASDYTGNFSVKLSVSSSGNGVFLPKNLQYPPPPPVAYDKPLLPLSSSKGSSSGYETPNSVETQDTFMYPDSQSTEYKYTPRSSRYRPRYQRPAPVRRVHPQMIATPSPPPYAPYGYVPNAPAYVPNMAAYQVRQPPYMPPPAQGYGPYPGQYNPAPPAYPMFVKYPQYVPNGQFYRQVGPQMVANPYVPAPPPPYMQNMVEVVMPPPNFIPQRQPQPQAIPFSPQDACTLHCGVPGSPAPLPSNVGGSPAPLPSFPVERRGSGLSMGAGAGVGVGVKAGVRRTSSLPQRNRVSEFAKSQSLPKEAQAQIRLEAQQCDQQSDQ
eukprot:TRINITY_DN4531_c1_g1_i5.p1 TRINITY_DN4531_c1_g1~~TRINITY_DN4531_c1_g1_i5.p1  ORF type:complete len:545 (-),score=75.29 TRINITY_DN4531_c1_g1_i5:1328-2962(-)